jgi:hypothetical protein
MGYRILLILLLWVNTLNAQMLCNGWRFGGGAPSFPTTNFLFGYAGDNGVTHSSNNVSAWDDMSVNNRDATQSNASNRPDWNTTDAITFVAANSDYLNIAYSTSPVLNLYFVVRINNLGSDSYIFGEYESYVVAYESTTQKIGVAENGTLLENGSVVANTSTYYLVHVHIETGTNASYISVNNGSSVTGTFASKTLSNPILLGALKFGGNPLLYGNITLKAARGYGTQNSTDIANTKAAFNAKYSLY